MGMAQDPDGATDAPTIEPQVVDPDDDAQTDDADAGEPIGYQDSLPINGAGTQTNLDDAPEDA